MDRDLVVVDHLAGGIEQEDVGRPDILAGDEESRGRADDDVGHVRIADDDVARRFSDGQFARVVDGKLDPLVDWRFGGHQAVRQCRRLD
jgi:hypothetical protein